jgi:hypothetical protein
MADVWHGGGIGTVSEQEVHRVLTERLGLDARQLAGFLSRVTRPLPLPRCPRCRNRRAAALTCPAPVNAETLRSRKFRTCERWLAKAIGDIEQLLTRE